MRLIWVLLAVQLSVYMAAWLLASVYIQTHKTSSRLWSESSGYLAAGLVLITLTGSIRTNPLLYATAILCLTQGFLSMSAAVASFFHVKHWSRWHLLFLSSLVALLAGLASASQYTYLRMPLLLVLYGLTILILIIRFHPVQVPEFGRTSSWVIHGPSILLALGMISYGVMGALSGRPMLEISVDNALNYALALMLLAAAGVMNFAYLLRLGLRLVRNLKELSQSDPLTGLANRRAFDDAIHAEHQRFVRSGRPYALISVDIDHFKSINDSFGHAAGDQVLVSVARLMAEHVRASDTAARVGGEEFLLLLTDSGLDAARLTAERLRQQIAASNIPWNDREITVTISLGIAQVTAPGEPVDNVMQRVDSALYEAKLNGRNCVVEAEFSPATPAVLTMTR